MATSQAQKLAVQKYRAKTYDTIGFDVRKGKREEYKAAAAELGLSLAAFLTNAADEYALNHTGADPSSIVPADNTAEKNSVDDSNQQPKITTQDRQLLDAINALSPESRKALLKFLQSLNTEILFLYNGSD